MDVETYCSDVTPGNGRLAACLYAHEDKVSDRCVSSIEDFALQMSWLSGQIDQAIDTCIEDINAHCDEVQPGEGRLFMCLKEKQPLLTKACQKVVTEFETRLTN